MSNAALFIAFVLAVVGAFLFLHNPNSDAKKRIDRQVAALGRKNLGGEAEDKGPAGLEWLADRLPLTGLVRAFLLANWRVDNRIAIGVPAGLLAIAVAIYAAWGPIAAALAAGLLVVAPYKLVQTIGQRNVRRFNAHLPSFIERLRMFLTSGSSLVTAFDKALDHSDRMVQIFLRPVAVRLSHGINLAEALRAQGNRLGIPEISMLAMVAHANLRFGGSLSDILDRLSDVVRGRIQAQSEFDAATSEVRSSSKVLFLLPVLVVGAIFAVKPDYLEFFVHERLGHYLLGYAVGSAFVGALVLNRLQTIRY